VRRGGKREGRERGEEAQHRQKERDTWGTDMTERQQRREE
jgi:hypothetical protein